MLALVAAGCGSDGREQSEPAVPAGLASELATRSDALAAKLDAGDPCGALADAESLQQETLAAVRAGRVPPRYRKELTAAVRSLAASIPCTITLPTVPEPAAPDDDEDDDEADEADDEADDDEDDDGKKNGKGKKGKRG